MTETTIPRALMKHSDDANAKARAEETELQDRQQAYQRAQNKFSRYFGEHLSGEQITAAERLLHEIEVTRQSGAAQSSYDGMPLSAMTYGAKTPAERVCDAFDYIARCKRAVREILVPYDLWAIFERAILADLSPQELGDEIDRYRDGGPDGEGQKKRRARAINLIDSATRAILTIPR